MSRETAYIIMVYLILSIIIAFSVNVRHRKEVKEFRDSDMPRYQSYMGIYGKWMPFLILAVLVLVPLAEGIDGTVRMMSTRIFPLAISTSMYYAVMLLLMPFMRKYIKPRTCSVIWFIPTFFLVYLFNNNMAVFPKVFLRVSETVFFSFLIIWNIGFFVIFLWNIIQHVKYRRYILEDAVYVTDEEILELWESQMRHANLRKYTYDLVISEKVKTPLTIGLFSASTVVVLPTNAYTLEELMLVFRHEIVHISREDAWSKFFMMFCTALNWYNPLMWIAMQKCKEEIELSCDETVMLNADESLRSQYARLILGTVGCEKGFTTCLSASANAMKYRLENIIKVRRLYSGGLLAGIMAFACLISIGQIGLSYGIVKGEDFIYGDINTDEIEIKRIENITPDGKSYDCIDTDAFHEYLKNLSAEQIMDERVSDIGEHYYFIEYIVQNQIMHVHLWDEGIRCIFWDNDKTSSMYYIREGIDWEYLNSLLVERKEPDLDMVHLDIQGEYLMNTVLQSLTRIKGDREEFLYTSDLERDDCPKMFVDASVSDVVLSFQGLEIQDYIITVNPIESTGQSEYCMLSEELEEKHVLPLKEDAAYYTVLVNFEGADQEKYKAEFMFYIEKW